MRTVSLCLLLACLAGCAPTVDAAATKAALEEADRAFYRATAARRAEGWVEFFAEDGAMIWPARTFAGKAQVRERITQLFGDTSFTLTWEPTGADVGAAGDLGYTIGRSESRYRDEKGNPVVRTGRYLTIWKKQADGSWKVAQDIGVSDPQPAAP